MPLPRCRTPRQSNFLWAGGELGPRHSHSRHPVRNLGPACWAVAGDAAHSAVACLCRKLAFGRCAQKDARRQLLAVCEGTLGPRSCVAPAHGEVQGELSPELRGPRPWLCEPGVVCGVGLGWGCPGGSCSPARPRDPHGQETAAVGREPGRSVRDSGWSRLTRGMRAPWRQGHCCSTWGSGGHASGNDSDKSGGSVPSSASTPVRGQGVEETPVTAGAGGTDTGEFPSLSKLTLPATITRVSFQ